MIATPKLDETKTLTDSEFLAELERIRRAYPPEPHSEPTDAGWLDRTFGIFADDLTFEEAVQLGREWRYADRPAEETPSESP